MTCTAANCIASSTTVQRNQKMTRTPTTKLTNSHSRRHHQNRHSKSWHHPRTDTRYSVMSCKQLNDVQKCVSHDESFLSYQQNQITASNPFKPYRSRLFQNNVSSKHQCYLPPRHTNTHTPKSIHIYCRLLRSRLL